MSTMLSQADIDKMIFFCICHNAQFYYIAIKANDKDTIHISVFNKCCDYKYKIIPATYNQWNSNANSQIKNIHCLALLDLKDVDTLFDGIK